MNEELWIAGRRDDLLETKKRSKPKLKPKGKDFIYEEMPRLILGLNARSKVWVYLLQQHRMQGSHKPISVSNVRLARLGVDRFAKVRALRSLERAGLIRMEQCKGCNPRVKMLI